MPKAMPIEPALIFICVRKRGSYARKKIALNGSKGGRLLYTSLCQEGEPEIPATNDTA
jgi:hypothetical protein